MKWPTHMEWGHNQCGFQKILWDVSMWSALLDKSWVCKEHIDVGREESHEKAVCSDWLRHRCQRCGDGRWSRFWRWHQAWPVSAHRSHVDSTSQQGDATNVLYDLGQYHSVGHVHIEAKGQDLSWEVEQVNVGQRSWQQSLTVAELVGSLRSIRLCKVDPNFNSPMSALAAANPKLHSLQTENPKLYPKNENQQKLKQKNPLKDS